MSDVEEPPMKMSKYVEEYLEDVDEGMEEGLEEPMEEGQEEWLSEGVLTDDDFIPTTENDKSDSNLNISQEDQDTMQSLDQSETMNHSRVKEEHGNVTQDIEEQLNKLETTKNGDELPDDLDAFLIRKTDGIVMETKVREVNTAKGKEDKDDGNDTDDLLRVLGDGDPKTKKKAFKIIKKEKVEDHMSSDDDDFIYEESQVKTLKIAKNALMKRPAAKAMPEDMSDGDDETDQSSDGSTVQRMFEMKNLQNSNKTEMSKKIVKHVVQVSSGNSKNQKPDLKTNIPKTTSKLTPKPTVQKKPTILQRPAILQKRTPKPVEVKTPAPFKQLDKSTSKENGKSDGKDASKVDELDEIIDGEEFLEEDDIDLDEEEFGEESEGEISKKQRIMRPEMMDEEVPSDDESHSEDGSLYDELPSSDSEDLEDWFTLDIRAERAGDYLPLLGSKAHELLIAERRRVSARVATLRQSLSALTDSARRQADQLRSAAMALAEIDDTLKAA